MRLHLNDKTSVPLFAVLGAVLAGASAFGGHFVWVAGISTKSEIAQAKNIEQDLRLDRQSQYMQGHFERQEATDKILLDRTGKMEAQIEILLRRVAP